MSDRSSERPTPVFTGGTGKSGTTVVAALLGRHPDAYASVPREIRLVTDRAGLLQLCYGPPRSTSVGRRVTFTLHRWVLPARNERALLKEFTAQMNGAWWSRAGRTAESGLVRSVDRADLDVLVATFLRDFHSGAEQAARELVFGIIAHQDGYTGQRLWIDSTPLNIANADRIARLLPEARFVHMVRDGRDTAVSITRQRWGPNEPFEALRWWSDRLVHAWEGSRDLPPSSLLTLRLEDLVVHDREASLGRLSDFLGLSVAERMRSFFDTRMPADKVRVGSWPSAVPDPNAFQREYERLVARMLHAGVPAALLSAGDGLGEERRPSPPACMHEAPGSSGQS